MNALPSGDPSVPEKAMNWISELEDKGILLPHEWRSGLMAAADRKSFYLKAIRWPKTRITMHNKAQGATAVGSTPLIDPSRSCQCTASSTYQATCSADTNCSGCCATACSTALLSARRALRGAGAVCVRSAAVESARDEEPGSLYADRRLGCGLGKQRL